MVIFFSPLTFLILMTHQQTFHPVYPRSKTRHYDVLWMYLSSEGRCTEQG